MTDDNAKINHIAMGAFSKYNAHMDYNPGDILLKLVTDESSDVVGRQQSMQSLLTQISDSIDHDMKDKLYSFLDLLLVKTSDFLAKYFEWLTRLAHLNMKAHELEEIASMGKKIRLHDGIVIHSATADTENKIKEQFGGYRWKRIMNFPLLVSNSQLSHVGERGGESFVSLVRDNIPNHQHGMTKAPDSSGDTWKINSLGSHPFLSSKSPGLTWDSKKVYPEISALNWNQDTTGGDSMIGGSRYVKPHFNIPPYKDAYIWECEQVHEPESAGIPLMESPKSIAGDPPASNGPITFRAVNRYTETRFKNFPAFTDPGIFNSGFDSTSIMNGWQTFISDALASEKDLRYDTKDAPLFNLGELVDWFIWCETMHVEMRYLFKDVYSYLLEDIQDRIYLLVKRISDALNNMGTIPQRVMKGQYVFLYGVTDEQETLNTYYKLPQGCNFVKVNNVFLRGTSMFTQETKGDFDKYVLLTTGEDKQKLFDDLTTTGGLSTINLYAENFPKHLHWSNLLAGMDSVKVERAPGQNTGGTGSAMMMNDPRSGGFKYNTTHGSGPYKVTINNYGSDAPISHGNMPKYIIMSVYVVS